MAPNLLIPPRCTKTLNLRNKKPLSQKLHGQRQIYSSNHPKSINNEEEIYGFWFIQNPKNQIEEVRGHVQKIERCQYHWTMDDLYDSIFSIHGNPRFSRSQQIQSSRSHRETAGRSHPGLSPSHWVPTRNSRSLQYAYYHITDVTVDARIRL